MAERGHSDGVQKLFGVNQILYGRQMQKSYSETMPLQSSALLFGFPLMPPRGKNPLALGRFSPPLSLSLSLSAIDRTPSAIPLWANDVETSSLNFTMNDLY